MNTSTLRMPADDAQNIQAIFNAFPGNAVLVKADAPTYTILAATAPYLKQTGHTKETMIGKGVFEAFPGNDADPADTGREDIRASYDKVLREKEPDFMPVQRYDLRKEDGSFSKHYWRASNTPVLGPDGEVSYVIHSAEDITHEITVQEQAEKIKGLEQAYGLFMQAPFAIHIFTGPDLIIDLANPPTLELWGKTEDITGKRFLDVLPELEGQGYEVMMREVMQSGIPRFFYEVPLALNRLDKEPTGYFNFIYQPYYKEGVAKAESVLIIANEVTQQVLARQQASESEQSLRLAAEIAHLGVFNIDLKTGIATYSQQIKDWFGFAQPTLPMAEILARVYPNDQPMVAETLERSITGEWDGQHDFEYRVLHPQTGAVQYLRSIGQVLYEDGLPLRLSGIIQEMTQQVASRRKLEESEARFRALANDTPAFMFMADVDANVEFVNRRWLSFVGLASEDGMGRAWETITHPDDLAPMYAIYADAVASMKPYQFEIRQKRNDGLYRWVLWNGIPRIAPDGMFAGMVGVGIDVTDQKEVELKIRESESRFRSLVEEATIATAVLEGEDWLLTFANEEMLQLWQRDRSIIGRTLLNFMPELTGQPFPDLLRRVYTTGKTYSQQDALVLLNRGGKMEEVFMDFSYKALRKENGDVYGILVAGADVSERYASKRRLEESEQRFQNLVRDAAVGIAVLTGEEMKLEIVNEAYARLLNLTPAVLMGQKLFDIVPGAEAYYRPLFNSVLKNGEPVHLYDSSYSVMVNNQLISGFINLICQPYRNANGDVVGVMILCYEVTQQVLSQKKLEQNEKQLETALEQMRLSKEAAELGTFDMDLEQGTLHWDNRCRTLFGISHRQPVTYEKDFAGGLYPDDKDHVLEVIRQSFMPSVSNGDYDVEYRTVGAEDGLVRWVRAKGKVYFNGDEEPIRFIGSVLDITEQVLSRKRLEESEERYRTLLEETTVATAFYTGPEVRIQYANATMLLYWGKGQEVIGKTFRQALPELESQPFPGLLEAVYATGESYIGTEEKAEMLVEGELRPFYFNFTYKALRDAEGRIYAIHHTAVDVTEQVTARQKIEQSEGNLTALALQAPMGICVMNADTLVTEIVNDAYVEIAGKPYEAIMGKYFWDVFPEAAPYYGAALQGVVDSGDAFHATEVPLMLIRHGKEENLHVTFVYEPLKDADGRVIKVVVWAVDNTVQVQTRQKIERSEQNFRNLILEAPVGVCVLDAGTLVAEIANDHFIEVAGRPYDAIVGKMYWDTFAEARPYYEAALQQVIKEGTTYYANEVELELVRHGAKEKVYVTFVYLPMKSGEESVTKVVIYVIENTVQVLARQKVEELVTERTAELAEANRTLTVTNAELQRSNQNLEEFAHAASHDLKEPVRKITFFTHQLKDQLTAYLKEAELRSFGRIENATERMGNLIDDLLLYSHVSQRPHETEAVDLTEKLKRVMEDLELDIQEKGAVIRVGKLPVVMGYRRQLQQLFQNLLSNALKYSRAGVPPVIDISAAIVTEHDRRYQAITFADNGIGFEQQYVDKIFQMFARLHGKSEYSGTGVGLSIVKKVVENHNGFIKVKSTVGQGSTFSILLPVK